MCDCHGRWVQDEGVPRHMQSIHKMLHVLSSENLLHLNKRYTVKPPNKGQLGAWTLVHYSEVVLYWFFVQDLFSVLHC